MSSENLINSTVNSISKQTLGDIAELVQGDLIGDSNCQIEGLSSLLDASEQELSFLLDKKYVEDSKKSNAAAFITFEEQDYLANQIVVKHPRHSLAILTSYFKNQKKQKTKSVIHKSAIVDHSVDLGEDSSIGAFAVIGKNTKVGKDCTIHPHVVIGSGCSIGKQCVLHPGVVIYDNIIIGDNCIIHAGTVVGSDGFGYVQVENGWKKIEHLGSVDIGSNVEIGANSAIDRGVFR
jgi:UDP-3-O-[3-hydroxymyristoyl] glucosamine N-acyltransferase